jgi:hypothetical protein
VKIDGRCVGCYAPMAYEGDDLANGAPFFEPIESHAVSYAHGHLCGPCAGAVKKLLDERRERREHLMTKADRLRRGEQS